MCSLPGEQRRQGRRWQYSAGRLRQSRFVKQLRKIGGQVSVIVLNRIGNVDGRARRRRRAPQRHLQRAEFGLDAAVLPEKETGRASFSAGNRLQEQKHIDGRLKVAVNHQQVGGRQRNSVAHV